MFPEAWSTRRITARTGTDLATPPAQGAGFRDPNGRTVGINSPKLRFTPEERIADMDASGTDMQVVSIHTPFFGYSWEPSQTLRDGP